MCKVVKALFMFGLIGWMCLLFWMCEKADMERMDNSTELFPSPTTSSASNQVEYEGVSYVTKENNYDYLRDTSGYYCADCWFTV